MEVSEADHGDSRGRDGRQIDCAWQKQTRDRSVTEINVYDICCLSIYLVEFYKIHSKIRKEAPS